MPLPAVKVFSFAPVTTEALTALKRESALLVDACPVSAPHGEWSRRDADGNSYAWAAVDHALRWELSGRALARNGLVNNVFPGMPLSAAALPFLNGDFIPFDFEPGTGTLFYDDPVFAPSPGRLPAFSCSLTLRFAAKRGSGGSYSGGGGGGYSSVAYFLPAVPVFRFALPALIALAEDVFTATERLGGGLQAAFYQGVPDGGGSLRFAAESIGAGWTLRGDSQVTAEAECLPKEWAVPGSDKAFNYLHLTRSGGDALTLRSLSLPETLTCPSGVPLAMAAGAFRAALAWSQDGLPVGGFAWAGIAHLLGDVATVEIDPLAVLTLSVWSGDPHNGGVFLDSWPVDRTAGEWSVSVDGDAVIVESAVDFTGSNARPSGEDWTGRFVALQLSDTSVNSYAAKCQLSAALTPAVGDAFTVPAGAVFTRIS